MSKPSHIAYIIENPPEGSDKQRLSGARSEPSGRTKTARGFDVVIYEQISVSGRITCTERKEKAPEQAAE